MQMSVSRQTLLLYWDIGKSVSEKMKADCLRQAGLSFAISMAAAVVEYTYAMAGCAVYTFPVAVGICCAAQTIRFGVETYGITNVYLTKRENCELKYGN